MRRRSSYDPYRGRSPLRTLLKIVAVVLAVACGVYFYGDLKMNAVFFPIAIVLFLLSFREMIGNLLRKIRK